jgi:hypothetical protein
MPRYKTLKKRKEGIILDKISISTFRTYKPDPTPNHQKSAIGDIVQGVVTELEAAHPRRTIRTLASYLPP